MGAVQIIVMMMQFGVPAVALQTSEGQLLARAQQKPALQSQLLPADAQIAQCLRKRTSDWQSIGTYVEKGLLAVNQAVGFFISDPPDIAEGVKALGTGLFEALEEPIEEAFSDTDAFELFRTKWMEFFESVPESYGNITAEIETFNTDGNPQALVKAISQILTECADAAMMFVPLETANEIVKYVDAVNDVMTSMGSAWAGFAEGEHAQATEDLYAGLKAGLDLLVPMDIQNDTTYQLIFGTLDGVMSELSETVDRFERQIQHSKVCWKVSESRAKIRPHVCQEGYTWDGVKYCLAPAQANLLQSISRLDGGLEKKVDGAANTKDMPEGAFPATCVIGGDYPEKHGHWCYKTCPSDMQTKSSNAAQCHTACHGEFPEDDGGMMCGYNKGVLVEATVNMVAGTIMSAFSAVMVISEMATNGVNVEGLTSTVDALVNIAQPFVHPNCPRAVS